MNPWYEFHFKLQEIKEKLKEMNKIYLDYYNDDCSDIDQMLDQTKQLHKYIDKDKHDIDKL